MAGDVPLAGFGVGRVAGVGFVELDVFLGDLTGRNGEGHIVVKEHLGLLLVGTVLVIVAHALFERTHAGAGHDLIVVAFGDVLFGHQVAVGVVPARLRAVVPGQQAHVPSQFEHRAGGQVDLAVGVDAEFGFETGAAGAPRTQLADGDDDDLVFRTGGDVLPILQIDLRLTRGARARQCLDQRCRSGTIALLVLIAGFGGSALAASSMLRRAVP